MRFLSVCASCSEYIGHPGVGEHGHAAGIDISEPCGSKRSAESELGSGGYVGIAADYLHRGYGQ